MRWAALVVLAACGSAAKPVAPVENHVAPPPLVASCSGACLPDLRFIDTHGHEHAVAGKVVVVTFWATWCHPCVKQLEPLAALDNVVVLTMLAEDQASDADADRLTQLPVIRASSEVMTAWNYPQALPTTFVYDKAGTQVFTHVGLVSKDQLVDAIKSRK